MQLTLKWFMFGNKKKTPSLRTRVMFGVTEKKIIVFLFNECQ